MRHARWAFCFVLLLVVLAVPACVELTGQRLAWFYDQGKDEIHLLLYYDGIHDSLEETHGKGAKQLPEFAASGDIMLLDWIGQVEMERLRREAENRAAKPIEREAAQLLLTIQARPVGYYREPDGRIGALQWITIPKATEFVAKANSLINRAILEHPATGSITRTEERIREAARSGHSWIKLEGQSIRVAVPVENDEWATLKAQSLKETGQWAASVLGEKSSPGAKDDFMKAVRALTAASLSYFEDEGRVEFIVGRRKTPSTLRAVIRDQYEPSLEKVVEETIKTDLDKAMAEAILGQNTSAPAAIRAALAWGPPEERIRALISAAQGSDAQRKEAALKQLASWAAQWNRQHGVPRAPDGTTPAENRLGEWKAWYQKMRQYPLPDDAPAAKGQKSEKR